jgi:hypothetical protein
MQRVVRLRRELGQRSDSRSRLSGWLLPFKPLQSFLQFFQQLEEPGACALVDSASEAREPLRAEKGVR